jgi:hypothetical protein
MLFRKYGKRILKAKKAKPQNTAIKILLLALYIGAIIIGYLNLEYNNVRVAIYTAEVKQEYEQIWQIILQSTDSILLEEHRSPLVTDNMFKECLVAMAWSNYATSASYEEIKNDYKEFFRSLGWTYSNSSAYQENVYFKTPNTHVAIMKGNNFIDETLEQQASQYPTTYRVYLAFWQPSDPCWAFPHS